jgi:hypothetical protein
LNWLDRCLSGDRNCAPKASGWLQVTIFYSRKLALLAGPATAVFAIAAPTAAVAQAEPNTPPVNSAHEGTKAAGQSSDPGTNTDIVIVGQRPRGSALGDVRPLMVLDQKDIKALGASSISELIQTVARQTGSGTPTEDPVILLNGKRISGIEDVSSIPPEAIERMDVLPPEVAAKYGYVPGQNVLNIVLRRDFRSSEVVLAGKASTEGAYWQGQAKTGRIAIDEDKRTSISLELTGNTPIHESDRNIALQPVTPDTDNVDPRPHRTLQDAKRTAKLSFSANRSIFHDVAAAFTAEVNRTQNSGEFGVATGTLDDSGVEILRAFPRKTLDKDTLSHSIHLGAELNGQQGKWRWSSSANVNLSNSSTANDRGFDLAPAQVRLDTDPAFDPFGELGSLPILTRNLTISKRRSFALDNILNGPLASLPAGKATATIELGYSRFSSRGESRLQGITSDFNDATSMGSKCGHGGRVVYFLRRRGLQ